MPPKKGGAQPSKKAINKKAEKIVEDRTFGLKNKNKSKKVQQHIKQVQANAKHIGRSHKQVVAEEQLKKEKQLKKEMKANMEKEMASLFKAVKSAAPIPAGVDPKSIICEHYKAGACKYGKKCKFSHDFEQARKVAKINLYVDPREIKDEAQRKQALSAESMDKWDQEKLEAVVAKKATGGPRGIICKYFLDAVENMKYGWLWECPNGPDCIYRHALPEGYSLKKKGKEKEEEEDEDAPTMEELLEEDRRKLDLSKCTPVTLETFLKWKEEKKQRRNDEIEKKRKEAEAKSGGKGYDVLSGRALFTYNPSLFVDDEDAVDDLTIRSDDEDEDDSKERGAAGADNAVPINEELFAGDEDDPDEDEA